MHLHVYTCIYTRCMHEVEDEVTFHELSSGLGTGMAMGNIDKLAISKLSTKLLGMYVCMYICHVCIYVSVNILTHTHMYMYKYMYMYVYIYFYLFRFGIISSETNGQHS